MTHRKLLRIRKSQGTIIVMAALALLAMFALAALSVDVGVFMVARNELQNISDGAALAATGMLGHIYVTPDGEQLNPGDIIAVAQDVGQKNRAWARPSVMINPGDVLIGKWHGETKTFTPGLDQPNAVRVMSRMDGSANGPLATYLARVVGIPTVDVRTTATAALTGQSQGYVYFPVGISKAWFTGYGQYPSFCNQPIHFYPTNDPTGCAGWNVFTDWPANANLLRDILEALTNRSYPIPEVTADVTNFNFIGGTLSSAFDAMKALFDAMKVLNDGVIDADDNPETWTTTVVVYNSDDCSNPHGSIEVVGFATVIIDRVLGPPTHEISGRVLCDYVQPGRGGGGWYGTYGSIPNLVQ